MFTLLLFVSGLGFLALAIRVKEDRSFLLLCSFGIIGFILYSNYYAFVLPSPDFNPYFSADSLAGVWTDRGSTISLNPDGSASFQLSSRHANRLGLADTLGHWYKESNFYICFVPKDGMEEQLIVRREGSQVRVTIPDKPLNRSERLRVLKYGNEFHLIIADFGDFDNWDGHPGFERLE